MTNEGNKLYNKDVVIDGNATKAIKDILNKGNDVVIRRKGNGIVILEDARKIKYDTTASGRK